MTKLNSSTRLKVKRDTFFLPDPKGGVYFRNNLSSFRMEGNTIYQWIETLMPMFNGEQTLGDLTKGLTAPYRDRVYEIGETLYKNGFVRDISKDTPHQLNSKVLERHASQIEFIENFVESGAYQFQEFRQAKVLAVGSGSFMISLVSALLETGLPKLNIMITDTVPTNRVRLSELARNARKVDAEVEIVEIPFPKTTGKIFWKEVVQPFDWILYVSEDGNIKQVRDLNQVCKEEKKTFLPALCLEHVGLSGPLVHPESDGCWESAWRRIHQTAVRVNGDDQPFSSTVGAILANVTVFEFFKKASGIEGFNQDNQIYLLDRETLEGDWISFITHPLVTSNMVTPRKVEEIDLRLKQDSEKKVDSVILLEYFSRLTSEEIGIFHTWEERNLTQLPLSQCYVQAVNPLSEGPADLLSEVICAGLTHEEAKRKAGLTGIEMYVARLVNSPLCRFENKKNTIGTDRLGEFIGIGAGETISEAVCRGLQEYLNEQLRKRKTDQLNKVYRLQLGTMEDQRCRFYLNALTTLNGAPTIGLKEEILGFPVIWVRSNGRLYMRADLTPTLALQTALQQALLDSQNQVNSEFRQEIESAVFLERKETKLNFNSSEDITHFELLQSSIQVLHRNRKRLFVYDLTLEPFLKQELAGVYGVQVGEEES
jgi:putative thiazole-containing bacteriocin maturation protein